MEENSRYLIIGLTILFLVAVGLLFWRKRNLSRKRAGGPCNYRNFPGICKIISIADEERTDRSIVVRFEFKSTGDLDLSGTFLEDNPDGLKGGSKTAESLGFKCIDNLEKHQGWFEKKDLEVCGVTEGSEFNCLVQVIDRGTCTPVNYRLFEEEDWIWGGTKTSSVGVIVADSGGNLLTERNIVPRQEFLVMVKDWTFSPGQALNKDVYFRLYNAKNPREVLKEKKAVSRSSKGGNYARTPSFIWTVAAPETPGNYTFRVVKEKDSWPAFNSHDRVEFNVNSVKQ